MAGTEEAAGSCKVDVGVNTDDVVDSEEVHCKKRRVTFTLLFTPIGVKCVLE